MSDTTPGALLRRMKRMRDRPNISEDHREDITALINELQAGWMPDVIAVEREYERILDEMGVPR